VSDPRVPGRFQKSTVAVIAPEASRSDRPERIRGSLRTRDRESVPDEDAFACASGRHLRLRMRGHAMRPSSLRAGTRSPPRTLPCGAISGMISISPV
jgi:hypothetical protein